MTAVPPRVAPYPNETALSGGCQRRIRAVYNGAVLKTHGNSAQAAGHPDLLACIRGRFVAVELKQPGNRPTQLQMKRLRTWQAAGALAGWCTTEVELDELLAHLDDHDWRNPQLSGGPLAA